MRYDPNKIARKRTVVHRRPTVPVRRRKVTLENYCFTVNELKSLVTNITNTFNNDLIRSLEEMKKEVKDKTVLTKSLITKAMRDRINGLNNDGKIIDVIIAALHKYVNILPTINDKIDNYVDSTICSNTNNLNYKLILSIISEGAYIAEQGSMILTYIMDKYYIGDKRSKIDVSVMKGVSSKAILFFQLIPEIYKADLNQVVKTIGEIPSIKTLKFEDTSEIPTDFIISDFFGKKFGIKKAITQVWVNKLLHYFTNKSSKKISKAHPEIVSTFIGNPIYHLRLLLVDLEMLKLETLKERKRILDLKLLELKQKETTGKHDPKIQKQIEYYEGKLEKTNLKIEKIMEIRVH